MQDKPEPSIPKSANGNGGPPDDEGRAPAASVPPAVGALAGSAPQAINVDIEPLVDLMRPSRGKADTWTSDIEVCILRAGGLTYGSEINYKGRTHGVPVLSRRVRDSMLLPSGLVLYGSSRELFAKVRTALREHSQLTEEQSDLLTYWAIASWFADQLPLSPSLAVTGPALEADLLLRLLRCVCRRPLLLAGISPAVVRSLPWQELMPTLLIREPQLNQHMAALLDSSNRPGYLVVSGNNLHPFQCTTCIYLGEDANPRRMGSYTIHVHLAGVRKTAIGALPSDRVVQDLQNRLFCYRLFNHHHVAASEFSVSELLPESCVLAQALGAPIVGDSALQDGLVGLLKTRDEQARDDRGSGLPATVLKALLFYCHQDNRQELLVKAISDKVNAIYKEEGEPLRFSRERVGHVLKNLGFYTRRLGSAGRGLLLDKAARFKAHELGYRHGVQMQDPEATACNYCHELQVAEMV